MCVSPLSSIPSHRLSLACNLCIPRSEVIHSSTSGELSTPPLIELPNQVQEELARKSPIALIPSGHQVTDNSKQHFSGYRKKAYYGESLPEIASQLLSDVLSCLRSAFGNPIQTPHSTIQNVNYIFIIRWFHTIASSLR